MGIGDRREVLNVPHIWRDKNDHPWVVVFYLARLGDRLECVGLELRSFVVADRDVDGMPDSYVGDALESVEPAEDDWAAGKAAERKYGDEDARLRLLTEELKPRPLSGGTLRALAMRHEMNLARQRAAEHVEDDYFHHMIAELDVPGPGEDIHARLADWQRWAEETRAAFASIPGKGRRKSYSTHDLQRVAEIYSRACRAGRPPTREVAEVLGLGPEGRNRAAKLVQRCRSLGLLGPTEKRKPGGVLPPEHTDRREDR